MVSRQTASQGKIYRFYKRSHWNYLQFIPCLDPLEEAPGGRPFSLTSQAYGDFLCILFELWYRDTLQGTAPSGSLKTTWRCSWVTPEACGMAGACGVQHVVGADGSVYPCDFYVLDAFRLGNLRQDSLETVNRCRKARVLSSSPSPCRGSVRPAPYLPLCRGGCRRYRLQLADGSLGKNIFCKSYR